MSRSHLSRISPRADWVVVLIGWAMAFFALTAQSRADVATRNVDYRVGGKTLKSVVFHDNEIPGRRPGILLAHEKGSQSAAARAQATRLARLGYIVMSVDLYSEGLEPKSEKEAVEQAALDAADRSTVRGRLAAALTALTRQPHVDPKQIAGVGYGIGGAALVELARTGVDLEGLVLLHGRPLPALPKDSIQIQPTMLLIAGESDASVPAESIKAFEDEMKHAKVECTVVRLPGVTHDFTDEAAGNDVKSGAAYDAAADRTAFEKVTAYLADEVPPHWAPRAAAAASTPGGKAAGTGQATAAGTSTREPARGAGEPPAKSIPAWPDSVPKKVAAVLKTVDETGDAPEGYEGGRAFGNYEHHLPAADRSGRRIKYREWDVNPHVQGVNRGVERLITGSDDSAYFTSDHYEHFTKIR